MLSFVVLRFSPLGIWRYMRNTSFLIMWLAPLWCAVRETQIISTGHILCHIVPPAHFTHGPTLTLETKRTIFPKMRTHLTQTMSCWVLHVWTSNSRQCSDLILQTSTRVHIWKRLHFSHFFTSPYLQSFQIKTKQKQTGTHKLTHFTGTESSISSVSLLRLYI